MHASSYTVAYSFKDGNWLTYADVTILSPKISPSGMYIGSELASGLVLSSSLTPGNIVRLMNGNDPNSGTGSMTIFSPSPI